MQFGSISHGTMRPDDLIPAFVWELSRIAPTDYAALIHTTESFMDGGDYDSEEAYRLLDELTDALDSCAPPYGYFGAHEGDGSDYGFWLCDPESIPEQVRATNGIVVSDLADIPQDYTGEVLIVNDHGNMTLGYVTLPDYKFQECWSVV